MFGDYLAGFFDGEGSFILRFQKDSRYKTGWQVKPHINITQKNKEVLEKIKDELKIGNLYFHKRDKIWYFNVHKIQHLLKFVSLLKGKMLVKAKGLEKFEQCLVLISKKEHLTEDGLNKIKMIWLTLETEANTP